MKREHELRTFLSHYNIFRGNYSNNGTNSEINYKNGTISDMNYKNGINPTLLSTLARYWYYFCNIFANWYHLSNIPLYLLLRRTIIIYQSLQYTGIY
jgi:hypothetical protein